MRKEFFVMLYILTSLMAPFTLFNYLNIHFWNISFNPVDFILKPFMIIPVVSLLLAVFTELAIYACTFAKKLSIRIKKGYDGKISLKIVEKSLPIYIIDQNYFNGEFQMDGHTVVDMRIKDRTHLSFGEQTNVVKLFSYDQQINIPVLLEKANLLIKDTALKKKPITFIVDSKQERNRTISKIWLRLILNPASRSAKTDIDTILQLVY
ncbi:hypothetical protein [Bacillus benzoevorans]